MRGLIKIFAILIAFVNVASAESVSDITQNMLGQGEQISEQDSELIEINPFFIREADAPTECLYESARVCDSSWGCYIEQRYVHKPCLVEEQLKKTLTLLKTYSQDASKENLSNLRSEIRRLSFMANENGWRLEAVLNSNSELYDELSPIKKWFSSIDAADADLLYQLNLHTGKHAEVERYIGLIDIELGDELRKYSTGEKQVNNIKTPTLMQRISESTGVDGDIITTLQIIEVYFNSLPLIDRKEAQLVLKARGLYTSDIDGVWGQNTRIAFAIFLAPEAKASSASSLNELFEEIKKGFIVENLWTRENYEEELREIWNADSKSRINSNSTLNSRLNSDLVTTTSDSQNESFVKNMFVNGEMKTCIKVGNSWNCD